MKNNIYIYIHIFMSFIICIYTKSYDRCVSYVIYRVSYIAYHAPHIYIYICPIYPTQYTI